MKYNWILFDADETLFSFDSFAGLKQLFANYHVDFTQEDFVQYQQINKPLWVAYQDGKIDAKTLQESRFSAWGKKLSVKPAELNHGFLLSMAEVCRPLDGVVELLQQLKDKAKLAIITNGFTAMQQLRLQKTGLKDYFEFVVVSEEIGVSKPNPHFFQHALALARPQSYEQVLVVGDTLESDILGGNNVGLDTCWLDHGRENLTEIKPTYQISQIAELVNVVNK
ncbi:pyrimidine 5'-nucleotidase [Gallibacterium trehalosifermentans]|uniref:Pyrimidine 5'-nucleotidase n=1 Tax=Gallibacterium trehalosifermentans TaxID=516935 RepID=A0ABV6H1S8_9PAST